MQPTTLIERPLDAPLFHRANGPVTAAAFLHDAHALARTLPDGQSVANLCQDRYAFAVTVAAALLGGRTLLLNAAGPWPPGCVVASDVPIAGYAPSILVQPSGEGPATTPENPVIPPDYPAAVVFTSGSTGAPVAHAKSWGALVARSRAAALQFGLDGATIVGTVPPQHMYGFETTVLLPFHVPVASWCGPAFFPADVAAALDTCPAPRILVTTPLHLRAVLQAGLTLPAMTACISATAPLDPALAAAAEAAWDTRVLEIFGATECGSIASRRTTAGPEWTPFQGITLTTSPGGATVHASGIAPTPLADLLEVGPYGFRLLGRRTDVVKLGGRRASLPGLNQLLTGLPGIDDGAFVMPDDAENPASRRLVAVVVAPGRSTPAILADLRRVIDPAFMPRRVVRVDAMPRNALGKLPRQALLQLVSEAG